MRIGSLFSGYGGLDLGVQAVLGGDVVWHVEYDKAPSRILAHHYPHIPNHGDVTTVDFTRVEPIDVLTGGYPCQPFSTAGKRKGTDDERHLWPHVLRAISGMGPRLVILENVRGHLSMGFDVVLSDLAALGWSAEWGTVRASDTGAPHQRARLFIVAYPGRQRHGPGQDARGLGRLDSQDAGSPREWERAREVFGDRGPAPTADATSNGRPPRGTGSSEWPGTTGQPASDHGPIANATGAEWGGAQSEHLAAPPGPAAEPGERPVWGDYGPAITRWEHLTGRPAPAPTETGRTGKPRLNPAFVEWMMGLPAGWVTDPAIGISRNDQLKALGNGVVPRQAALAVSLLTGQAVAA